MGHQQEDELKEDQEDFPVEVEEDDQDVNTTEEAQVDRPPPLPQQPTAVRISRSWDVQTAHVPTFTGGKVTHGLSPVTTVTSSSSFVSIKVDETNGEEGQQQRLVRQEEQEPLAFLLLQVAGDVAVVHAIRGVTLGSLRRGPVDWQNILPNAGGGDEDEDEFDAEAITSYAMAASTKKHHTMIVTCSRNLMLKQYTVSAKASGAATSSSSTAALLEEPVLLEITSQSWGKSGHTLPVTLMEFHTSSIFMATGGVDGTVRVWDVRGGSAKKNGGGGGGAAFLTHLFRPLGREGDMEEEGGSGRRSVTALTWLDEVTRLVLAIGRDDGSICIHDLRESDVQQAVVLRHVHVSAVTCLKWNWQSQAQGVLISGGRDAVLNVWKIRAASNPSQSKSKSKRKSKASSTAVGQDVYEHVQTLPIYEQVEGLVLLPRGQMDRHETLVATAGSKGRVRLWKLARDDSSKLQAFAEQPSDLAFGEERGGYMSLYYDVNVASSSTSQGRVDEQLVVADAEHNLSFLSLTTDSEEDELLTTERTIVGHNDDILDLKVIPNGNANNGSEASRVVVATNSAQVRIFDLHDFSCQILDGHHTATVLCVDVSPCGRYVATCGKDKQMRMWDVPSGSCVASAIGHAEAVGSTALSRKVGRYQVNGKAAANGGGSFCVTVSVDRTLKRWNLPGTGTFEDCIVENTGPVDLKAFVSVRAHDKDINIVTVAPNDSLVATGSQDKTVKLWKSTDLSLVATLKGHRRGLWDCQFSPYDRVLATGSGDKTIKLWSLGDYSCVRTFQGHVASVLRVRFLSGGLQLVSSGADGLVKLWTIRTNECETTMDGHSDKVWALDLAPSQQLLVTGGADSQLVVWKDTTQEVEDAKQAEEEETILLDQQLANHLRHKEYTKALEIALTRDKPLHALKVLTAIVEGDLKKGLSGLESVKACAKGWTEDRLVQVLRYCREWNTRARNSHIALLTIRAIVVSHPANVLASTPGIPEILAGIIPYAERHFDRLDRLHGSSFLLDFTLFSMGSIEDDDTPTNFGEYETERLVLPPQRIDGRVQVGGKIVVGSSTKTPLEDVDEVMTVGESSDDSSYDDDE